LLLLSPCDASGSGVVEEDDELQAAKTAKGSAQARRRRGESMMGS
jgi:hypothetical protein